MLTTLRDLSEFSAITRAACPIHGNLLRGFQRKRKIRPPSMVSRTIAVAPSAVDPRSTANGGCRKHPLPGVFSKLPSADRSLCRSLFLSRMLWPVVCLLVVERDSSNRVEDKISTSPAGE